MTYKIELYLNKHDLEVLLLALMDYKDKKTTNFLTDIILYQKIKQERKTALSKK